MFQIFEKDNGTLWVGGMQGLRSFNTRSQEVTSLRIDGSFLKDVTVRNFVKINANEFWMATNRGIYILDSSGLVRDKIQENVLSRNSLAANDVQALCKDLEGVYGVLLIKTV
ncbi:hypothetical protein [Niabella hibiscisoli]|uniref:hypothetical protein n=1 Tax=Niabella hibiscisoli TaxID=1825928 RepID=UPI001F0E5FCE|nr:hypothetical protein [Niabella hibiscisoli]MCH5720369.1 hypothetical protein [Niabella hibiscisoli]